MSNAVALTFIGRTMKKLGKKPADIAPTLGLHESTVRHWTTGLRAPSPRHWRALADLLGVSLARLTASLADAATEKGKAE